MKFENIGKDTNCNCLDECFEDLNSEYLLKINYPRLREKDFETYWEKGRRPPSPNDCKKTCSLKGQSLSIIEKSEDLDSALEIYKKLFPLAPGYKPYCAILKLKKGSGLVKKTPSTNNPMHCDLYKCDEFSKKRIELIKYTFV